MTTPRRLRTLLGSSPEESDALEAAEVRRAMRALLRRPMLHATGTQATDEIEEDLRLVRRHREALSDEFSAGLRYRLLVEPAGARLVKTGLGRDSSRPLRRPMRSGLPGRAFNPRTYALLLVTLAVLTRSRTQLLLEELVGEVRSRAAEIDLAVDLDAIADRRALQAVLLVLTELGVLSEQDGDLEHWAENTQARSLLEISVERLGLLLAVPMPVDQNLEEILSPTQIPSAAGGARISTRRILVENPILSTEDLSPEYQEWWSRTRNQQVDWFENTLGLSLELRAEGAVAIDRTEELTDITFPGTGTVKHASLLLLTTLTTRVREAATASLTRTWWTIPQDDISRALRDVHAGYSKSFAKDYRDNPDLLLTEIGDLLVQMGLIRRTESGWLIHAAAARYGVLANKVKSVDPDGLSQ